LQNLTGAQISTNLGQLVNTLWLAGIGLDLFLGANLSEAFEEEGANPPIWVPGNATGHTDSVKINVYVVSWAWCVVLIICSVFLLVASTAAAIFEARTIGPDFLGFANTAVRKGVKLPKHMNSLSARDRLQALQEHEVLLQDVRPGDDMGKVALGVKEEHSVKLVHGRQYR